MTPLVAFVTTVVPFRHNQGRHTTTCPRRKRPIIAISAHEGENTTSNSQGGQEAGALPPGVTSSKSTDKSDFGFVGADRIGISFVCTADDCNTRISKTVRRHSYEKGTVVIQCPECAKHHVIADNTGMYSELTGGKANIEEIARAKGESVTRVDDKVFNLETILANLATDKEQTTETDVAVDEHVDEPNDGDSDKSA